MSPLWNKCRELVEMIAKGYRWHLEESQNPKNSESDRNRHSLMCFELRNIFDRLIDMLQEDFLNSNEKITEEHFASDYESLFIGGKLSQLLNKVEFSDDKVVIWIANLFDGRFAGWIKINANDRKRIESLSPVFLDYPVSGITVGRDRVLIKACPDL